MAEHKPPDGNATFSRLSYFAKHSQIESAYLGTIQIPAQDDEEHLMVGIKGTGDFQKIIDVAVQKISLLKDEQPYSTLGARRR